jgi:beta-alanine--pyruvate transaminase
LLTRGAALAKEWEDAVHSLRDSPHVIDIRNIGLVAGIELQPRAGSPGARAYDVFVKAFERGILIRITGDIIALSPPLIVEPKHIDQLVSTLKDILATIA